MSSDTRKTILLVSPYWREDHRWMVSSVKLAELWQRMGYAVTVVCMGPRTSVSRISDTLTIHSIKDFFLPDPWNYGIAVSFARYALRIAQEVNPDIVIINKILFWSSLSIFTLRRKGYKVLLLADTLVGITWMPRSFVPKIGAMIYAWTLGKVILKKASRIVFFHPQPERILKRLGVFEKSEVIPTGIDVARYSFDRSQVVENNQKITVTYIGRLESVKGVDDFLAAAVPLIKDHPSIHIQVVGWYKKNHPLVRQYGNRVTFAGLRDDVAAILRDTDIFVLPSHSEGLSNALMEAMASGCACIASNVGGSVFLIEDGRSGLLFNAGDREALRIHIEHLLVDAELRRRLGDAARSKIAERFSWDKVSASYADLFARFSHD